MNKCDVIMNKCDDIMNKCDDIMNKVYSTKQNITKGEDTTE